MNGLDDLATELAAIYLMESIKDYDLRNRNVIKAVWLAQLNGLQAGFRIDPKEPEWPCAYIELPTGQVTWHLPQHPIEWDNHTGAEKYKRCRDFIDGYGQSDE